MSETINSAINQTYKNIEIIICDNCSTDGTWELLQKYAQIDNRILIFRNSENIGPVRNWEKCILNAKGQYSKILFSDDLIKNTFIEHTLSIFSEDSAFVFTPTQMFFNQTNSLNIACPFKSRYKSRKYIEDVLLLNLNGFPVSPGCAIFRTDDLKKSLLIDIPNNLNLDFKLFGAGNDLLLLLNIALKYEYVRIYPETETYFRSHINSFTTINNLSVYYEYAKLYYILNNRSIKCLPKFKTVLWIRKFKQNSLNVILNVIDEKINIFYLFSSIVKLILKRTKINIYTN